MATLTVFGIARSKPHADAIILQLMRADFGPYALSALQAAENLPEDRRRQEPAPRTSADIPGNGKPPVEGALGLLPGLRILTGTDGIPLVASGTFADNLEGLASRGLVEGLLRLGMTDYEARRFEHQVKEGDILICARAETAEDTVRATEIFEQAGVWDVIIDDDTPIMPFVREEPQTTVT